MSNHIVQWLSDPAAYPHPPQQVEHIETHISHVFLAGELVYKLKKPVRFDFLDFSTVALREQACREELRLNRRLAPSVYLDVVPLTQTADGGRQIGGDGPAIDWLVEMRRLPLDQTLESLLARGELTTAHVDRLADVLASFYQGESPAPLSAAEYRHRCTEHVQGNRTALLTAAQHLPEAVVKRIHAVQLQMLALNAKLFDGRVAAGRIIEGHGDLRPEHICFTDPPVVFDCIEFSREFRTLDVADELAFLAEECDHLDAGWVGQRVLERYAAQSGDQPPWRLMAFYKSYRACVRAKVDSLRSDQLRDEERQQAIDDARKRLLLAERYLLPWQRPLVVAVGGLSGTGKSTLAAALAEALGADLLRTDVVRQELFPASKGSEGIDTGKYSPEARRRVYDELMVRAGALHREGISVVLDGTFSQVDHVQAARGIVGKRGDDFLAVQCVCRPELARQRIVGRLAAGSDASEATPELHKLQQQRWETWPAEVPQCRVDTEQPLADQVAGVAAALAGTGATPAS